ncbi:hypothetical protein LCGC14_2982840, partial [marine sediment metagenome]
HGGAHYDGYGAIHGIPNSPTDTRTGHERFRFIGGSTNSKRMVSPAGNWNTGGVSTSCYFINPDPQPWSNCSHHNAGSVSSVDTYYGREPSY